MPAAVTQRLSLCAFSSVLSSDVPLCRLTTGYLPLHRRTQAALGTFPAAQATRLWPVDGVGRAVVRIFLSEPLLSCSARLPPASPLLALGCLVHIFYRPLVASGVFLCVRAPPAVLSHALSHAPGCSKSDTASLSLPRSRRSSARQGTLQVARGQWRAAFCDSEEPASERSGEEVKTRHKTSGRNGLTQLH